MSERGWAILAVAMVTVLFSPLFISEYSKGQCRIEAIQASAIQNQGGAAYVQLKAIEKWDGNLPNVMSGAVPFINVGK